MNPDGTPTVHDSLVLDGILERHRLHPGLIAAVSLLTGMATYMVVGNLATLLWLIAGGTSPDVVLRDITQLMEAEVVAVLGGNAIGLVCGLGVLSFLLVRLQTKKVGAFVRLKKPDGISLLLSVVGLLILLPVIQWAGHLNERLPLPDFLRMIEEMQMELLEQVLLGEVGLLLSILLVAVTPAICEEIFFRGYVQRNLERAAGVVWGIALTGLVFGLFHLRLTQVLPLAILGVYFAYLTWRTGSLWIPIVLHFINNAIALVVADILKSRQDFDVSALEAMSIPTYLALICLALFAGLLYLLHATSVRGQLRERL